MFGVYKALTGKNNWDAIRQGRANELQLATLQASLAEQQLQREQLAGQEIQNSLNEVNALSVLDPDLKRIREVNKELVAPIKKGLMQANGDVEKYLLSGGQNELMRYRNALMTHPTVRRALLNAYNYNQYQKDVQAGLNPRGDMKSMVDAYFNQDHPAFDYYGAYKRPSYDAAEHFAKFYGKDRYKQEPVTPLALHRYVFEAAKKEGLNDQDATEFANKEAEQYMGYVKSGANPFYYKWDDPLKKQVLQSIAYKNYGGGQQQQMSPDWLFAFKQTNPFDPRREFVPADEHGEYKSALGAGYIGYNLGADLAKNLANATGYDMDNKGDIVNKGSAISKNNFFVGADKLDIGDLSSENIKSLRPTGRALKVYDKNGNLVSGIEYEMKINEPGIEAMKYKGQSVSQGIKDQTIPFAKTEDNEGFGWFGLGGDDYSMTLKVYEPIPNSPQVEEEYRRLLQRNSSSAQKGTAFSFMASGALQNDLMDRGSDITGWTDDAIISNMGGADGDY